MAGVEIGNTLRVGLSVPNLSTSIGHTLMRMLQPMQEEFFREFRLYLSRQTKNMRLPRC